MSTGRGESRHPEGSYPRDPGSGAATTPGAAQAAPGRRDRKSSYIWNAAARLRLDNWVELPKEGLLGRFDLQTANRLVLTGDWKFHQSTSWGYILQRCR